MPGEISRRALAEVVARADLERELPDLYVEGAVETDLYRHLFMRSGDTDVRVYEISTVDVSAERLPPSEFSGGNRSRVVALASALNAAAIPARSRVACVIDSDLEEFVPELSANPFLLRTDGASIEWYCVSRSVLDKFLRVVCHLELTDAGAFRASLIELATRLTESRLASIRLGWRTARPALARSLVLAGAGRVALDIEDFVGRFLSRAGKTQDRSRFDEELRAVGTIDENAVPHACRGTDLLEVILWYVRKRRAKRVFQDELQLGRVLLGCLDADEFEGSPLMKSIRTRIRR